MSLKNNLDDKDGNGMLDNTMRMTLYELSI